MSVYVIDKPLGLTSHDAVREARKLFGTRRIGHAGTLDPLATGVLVLLKDDATKLSPFLSASKKSYLAWVSFGATTPTLDAEGPISTRGDAGFLEAKAIEEALPSFLELAQQVPPEYSAVKRGGVRGYDAARRGKQLNLEARPARYLAITLLDFAPTLKHLPQRFVKDEASNWRPDERGIGVDLPQPLGAFPTALFTLTVGAGTYVRSFARDLGRLLDVPAHLAGLLRTRSGALELDQAISLEQLPQTPGIPLADAIEYPRVVLDPGEVARIRQGQRLRLDAAGRVSLTTAGGALVAIAEVDDGRMTLLRVWQ